MTDFVPDQKIQVDVDFYNDEHRTRLLQLPTARAIREVVQDGISIRPEEFLTYYLFHRKRPGKPGYRSYRELGRKIGLAISELEDWLEFNGVSVSIPMDTHPPDKAIIERIGESLGLGITNRIHELTEADWDRIPLSHGAPTLDYEIASDGRGYVQLETKGSYADDNRKQSSNVSNQKRRIETKKAYFDRVNPGAPPDSPTGVRYGTIAVLDSREDSVAKCWLLDPDSELPERSARDARLISRVQFLHDWVSFISPRSQLAVAIANRIADMIALEDPFELDGVPLRGGTGEELYSRSRSWIGPGTFPFFSNKSKVVGGPTGGVVVQMSPTSLFFLGVMEEFIELALRQDFETILSYRRETPGTTLKTVECVLSQRRFERMRLPDSLRDNTVRTGGYCKFRLRGRLFYNTEGCVFGALPIVGPSREARSAS